MALEPGYELSLGQISRYARDLPGMPRIWLPKGCFRAEKASGARQLSSKAREKTRVPIVERILGPDAYIVVTKACVR
jgi:hypothetical protein